MRTAKEIISKSEYNKFCVSVYAINHNKRGYKTFLKNCIGAYDANIIINTQPHKLAEFYK